MNMKIVLASNNKHKVAELYAFMKKISEDIEILTLSDIGFTDEIIEDGETFEENALIKARAISKLGYIAVADDSGLCVDALGGEPGVYSARYAGEPCDDEKNNDKLLEAIKEVPDGERSAWFVSAIACAFPDGKTITAIGRCPGEIIRARRGNGGFGYDPLFWYKPLGKTYAELTAEEKSQVSHRARAMEKFTELFAKEMNL